METSKLRRQIAFQAALMLYQNKESDINQAKWNAARSLCKNWVKPKDLPTEQEIRDELQSLNGIVNVPTGDRTQDPFDFYYQCLLALESVQQPPTTHPEGDALYHSLQVFDLACDCLPYDEEFLLAALLHDIGKAIDPLNPIESGLEALKELITPRTYWLIENLHFAHRIHDRSIGSRARRRLEADENFDELCLLGDCDRKGRRPGQQVTELPEALDYIRGLAQFYE
ncbi:MAG: HD domain-containing protein [Planctomycetota bacterium]